ncbi:DUF2255 family protein [Phytohabitans houttuyneae]|uniref:DUF2255 domain-containing protein n=1 Tax=Phytohabitans houttuyneae TaxID=1076126 RepID=A0A6V8JXB8_9ACTN|nr:DUF2255 family protein [Phytohabitans houttuyneae]GFJ75844.1 hypothetical protein Phou_000240 [Phytohabitans houttuyneae]
MSDWKADELTAIEGADELRIAPLRRNGTLREPTTIWVVRDGDDLYVRSFKGAGSHWYRGTRARHQGHIEAGGVGRDVRFVDETDPGVNARIDDAYRGKYQHYGAQYVDPMLAPPARAATLRLEPR